MIEIIDTLSKYINPEILLLSLILGYTVLYTFFSREEKQWRKWKEIDILFLSLILGILVFYGIITPMFLIVLFMTAFLFPKFPINTFQIMGIISLIFSGILWFIFFRVKKSLLFYFKTGKFSKKYYFIFIIFFILSVYFLGMIIGTFFLNNQIYKEYHISSLTFIFFFFLYFTFLPHNFNTFFKSEIKEKYEKYFVSIKRKVKISFFIITMIGFIISQFIYPVILIKPITHSYQCKGKLEVSINCSEIVNKEVSIKGGLLRYATIPITLNDENYSRYPSDKTINVTKKNGYFLIFNEDPKSWQFNHTLNFTGNKSLTNISGMFECGLKKINESYYNFTTKINNHFSHKLKVELQYNLPLRNCKKEVKRSEPLTILTETEDMIKIKGTIDPNTAVEDYFVLECIFD